jgi:alpha-D-ribose 1-methylphosphonate 5-triphosphate synthase subunit PhnI
MYVAVKGGEKAIANAHLLLADRRRGDQDLAVLSVAQIAEQLSIGVARVMAEGSLYDPDLAALAIIQGRGDAVEAICLVRSYRATLPRFGYSEPVNTGRMRPDRRISATFKDLPGGQVLGSTFDYTHRLLDESVADPSASLVEPARMEARPGATPRVIDLLGVDSLIEPDLPAWPGPPAGAGNSGQGFEEQMTVDPELDDPGPADPEPGDLTREPWLFPMSRAERLQALARGDEGFLLALGYSTQRGFGRTHPFAGEIRVGEVTVDFFATELGFDVPLGAVKVTECQMVSQFVGSITSPPQFTRGYGLTFGHSERKAIAMSLCDRALRSAEFGEEIVAPAQDEEFVISHCDNVQSSGFVEHLKLPHHVDFQAELELVRRMRAEHCAAVPEGALK